MIYTRTTQNLVSKSLTGSIIIAIFGLLMAESAIAEVWKEMKDDGIHDPEGPAIGILQDPSEGLGVLPPDTAGNKVNWVEALEGNYIQPRAELFKGGELEILDSIILFTKTGDMPHVLFPHRPHTQWLECSNCHEGIFKSKAGATQLDMFSILQGQFCGTCHGAVSFPLTECNRCHKGSN